MKYIQFNNAADPTQTELIPIDGPMTTPCIDGAYFLCIGSTTYLRFNDASACKQFWNDFARQMWADGASIFNVTSTRWKGATNGVCNF